MTESICIFCRCLSPQKMSAEGDASLDACVRNLTLKVDQLTGQLSHITQLLEKYQPSNQNDTI